MATTTTKGQISRSLPTDNSSNNESVSENCNDIRIPDYNTLRKQNLDKINTYYSQLLDSYSTSYRDYSTQTASSNVNDRLYAKNNLKPSIDNYNQQLINVTQNMINNVNQDTDLIMAQKDELLQKTRNIDQIMNNITLLKDKDNEMVVLTKARLDSLNSAETSKEDMQFYTYIYIGICALLLICILGIIMYIVYSNYSPSNNSSKMNNVYRNIPGYRS